MENDLLKRTLWRTNDVHERSHIAVVMCLSMWTCVSPRRNVKCQKKSRQTPWRRKEHAQKLNRIVSADGKCVAISLALLVALLWALGGRRSRRHGCHRWQRTNRFESSPSVHRRDATERGKAKINAPPDGHGRRLSALLAAFCCCWHCIDLQTTFLLFSPITSNGQSTSKCIHHARYDVMTSASQNPAQSARQPNNAKHYVSIVIMSMCG